MLTQEDYWMIQELHQQGVYRGDIAERLGVHRKTVGRALERGGPPSSKRRRERYAKLSFVPKACRPYRPRTKGKVERLVGYVKQHFFQRYRGLRELGASGPAPGGVAA